MQPAAVPLKTPSGQEELRLRSRRLGQRYRTVLLLVDGHRTLGDVLRMAQQAGAHIHHLEELIKLGLVELPQPPAAPPEPEDTPPDTHDHLRVTRLDVDVLIDLPQPAAPAESSTEALSATAHHIVADVSSPAATARRTARTTKATRPMAGAVPATPPEAQPEKQATTRPLPKAPGHPAVPHPGGTAPEQAPASHPSAPHPAPPPPRALAASPNLQQPDDTPSVPTISIDLPTAPAAAAVVRTEWINLAPPPPPSASEAQSEPEFTPMPIDAPFASTGSITPSKSAAAAHAADLTAAQIPLRAPLNEAVFAVADHARPAPRLSDAKRVDRIRQLLLYTLGADGLLFSTLTLTRVRAAQTQKDLISLVWEIERQRAHSRRSREQLLSLQRARELLGMGNTLVTGDSQPAWPDTEGQV